MENSFKQKVEKYSLYQNVDGRLIHLPRSGEDLKQVPVIQLSGNDFDGRENISCEDLLRISITEVIDEKKTFYQSFIYDRNDYKQYTNVNSVKGKIEIKRKDQTFTPSDKSSLVLSYIKSLYNRYEN